MASIFLPTTENNLDVIEMDETEYRKILMLYQDVSSKFLDETDLEKQKDLRKQMRELSKQAKVYETHVYIEEFMDEMKANGAVSLKEQEIKVHQNGAKVLIPTTFLKNEILKEKQKYTMLFIPTP